MTDQPFDNGRDLDTPLGLDTRDARVLRMECLKQAVLATTGFPWDQRSVEILILARRMARFGLDGLTPNIIVPDALTREELLTTRAMIDERLATFDRTATLAGSDPDPATSPTTRKQS